MNDPLPAFPLRRQARNLAPTVLFFAVLSPAYVGLLDAACRALAGKPLTSIDWTPDRVLLAGMMAVGAVAWRYWLRFHVR